MSINYNIEGMKNKIDELELSINSLCDTAGVSRNLWYKMSRGENITIENASLIANVLGLGLDDIVSLEENKSWSLERRKGVVIIEEGKILDVLESHEQRETPYLVFFDPKEIQGSISLDGSYSNLDLPMDKRLTLGAYRNNEGQEVVSQVSPGSISQIMDLTFVEGELILHNLMEEKRDHSEITILYKEQDRSYGKRVKPSFSISMPKSNVVVEFLGRTFGYVHPHKISLG